MIDKELADSIQKIYVKLTEAKKMKLINLKKWNYATPAARVWTNEAVAYGRTYPPNISYESDIYCILYKAKNQSGLQAKELTEEDTLVLN